MIKLNLSSNNLLIIGNGFFTSLAAVMIPNIISIRKTKPMTPITNVSDCTMDNSIPAQTLKITVVMNSPKPCFKWYLLRSFRLSFPQKNNEP